MLLPYVKASIRRTAIRLMPADVCKLIISISVHVMCFLSWMLAGSGWRTAA